MFTGPPPAVDEDDADKEAIRQSYLELKAKKRLEDQLKKTELDLKDKNKVLSPYDSSKQPAGTGWSFLQAQEEKPARPAELKKKRLEDEFEAWRKSKEAASSKYQTPDIESKFVPTEEYHVKPIVLPEAPKLEKKHIIVDAAGDLDDGIPEEWEPEDDEPELPNSGPSFEELAAGFFEKTFKLFEYVDFKLETAPKDNSLYNKNKEFPDEWILYRHEHYVPIYEDFDKAAEKLAADKLTWQKYQSDKYDEMNRQAEELASQSEEVPEPTSVEVPLPVIEEPAPDIEVPVPVPAPAIEEEEVQRRQDETARLKALEMAEQAERLRMQEVMFKEMKNKISEPPAPAPVPTPAPVPEEEVVEVITEFEKLLASKGLMAVVYLPTKDGSAKSKKARVISDIGSPFIEIEVKSGGEKRKLKFDIIDVESVSKGSGASLTLPDAIDNMKVIHFNIKGKPELNLELESLQAAQDSLYGFTELLKTRSTLPTSIALKWVCFAELEEKKMISTNYTSQLLIFTSSADNVIQQYAKSKNATTEVAIIPKLRQFKEGGWDDSFLVDEGWVLKGRLSMASIKSITTKQVKGVDSFAEIVSTEGTIVYRLPDTNMRNMFVKFINDQSKK